MLTYRTCWPYCWPCYLMQVTADAYAVGAGAHSLPTPRGCHAGHARWSPLALPLYVAVSTPVQLQGRGSLACTGQTCPTHCLLGALSGAGPQAARCQGLSHKCKG
jgi:hypothetical protein